MEDVTPFILGACHLAVVALMIKAGEMQHAMQHENSDFFHPGMAVLICLSLRALNRNCEFADLPGGIRSGKREHVGRVVASQEFAIQAKQLAIIRQEASKGAPSGNARGKRSRELLQFPFLNA